MKIVLPKIDEYAIGGGWSFISNFRRAMGDLITDYDEADIYFIPGASMVDREQVKQAQADGKRIVLRVDNVIRNSRNRGSGMSRMADFAQMSDLVIFQSHFAEKLLNPFLLVENYKVILNAVDETVFHNKGRANRENTFLYSKYSSDETKNWEMARIAYQHAWDKMGEGINLNIVGRFDAKIEEYDFDFFNGEKYTYYGLVTDKNKLADIYRDSDYFLYTYFNDACSNTAIEALMCGVELVGCFDMEKTGGLPEIMHNFNDQGRDYFKLDRLAKDYKEAFNGII